MADALDIQGIRKSFTLHTQGGVKIDVLRGFSLAVENGECVVLCGPSGAGKSTLLRCVYGNYRTDSGRVVVRDRATEVDVATATPRQILKLRRRTVGYVSQFLRVVPRVATLEVVSEPLRALGLDGDLARERAGTLLGRLRVPERLWSLAPATFSGGERQRVNVARGFVVDYPVLLLDEPTASLDEANRRSVVELIGEARARGAAVLGVFHDEAIRDAVATRTVDLELEGSPT